MVQLPADSATAGCRHLAGASHFSRRTGVEAAERHTQPVPARTAGPDAPRQCIGGPGCAGTNLRAGELAASMRSPWSVCP